MNHPEPARVGDTVRLTNGRTVRVGRVMSDGWLRGRTTDAEEKAYVVEPGTYTVVDRAAATGPCVFCEIVAGRAPARFVVPRDWRPHVVAFAPLDPVTPGHALFVPRRHVIDAADDPYVTAVTMQAAADWAAERGWEFNLLTSAGHAATQSIFHLHIHYVPRSTDDGLMLPWGTLHGENPSDPHRCRGINALSREIESCVAPHNPPEVLL